MICSTISHYRITHKLRAQAPVSLGGPAEEVEEANRTVVNIVESHVQLNPDDVRAFVLGAASRLGLGDREGGLRWARRALEVSPDEQPMVLYNVACCYTMAGESDEAIDLLERAVELGFGHREWIEHDSDLEPLRDSPRFGALLDRMAGD